MRDSPRLISTALALLILTFGARCYRTYRVFNDTVDESGHVACGLEVWQEGRYTLETQHPPLGNMVVGILPYLAGLRQTEQQRRIDHDELWIESSRAFYWRTLSLARMGNLVYAPLLLVYVYLWGRQLYGPMAGLGAAAITAFCPNLLGHASLATLDFGATATSFASAYHFWRWSQDPGLRNCIIAAVVYAIAVLTKFSALFLVPLIALGFVLLARWGKPRRWTAGLRRAGVFVGVAALAVWAGYGFGFGPLPPAQIPPVPGTPGQYMESAVEVLTGHGSIPAPRFARGIFELLAHNARGHPAYLLGEIRQFGWWYYFPVALAVKTTLPLLLLVPTAVAFWVAKRGGGAAAGPMTYPLVAAAAILAVSMASRMNLGVRYILLIFPFFALLAAGLFRAPQRLLVGWAIVLAAWHGAESLLAHPDYLAYFNQIARGREERFLLDSNLDWGQDLERLRQALEERKISSLYLSYFGQTNPRLLGISGAIPLRAGLLPTGWVAVSKSHIGGVGRDRAELAWLKGHQPAAQIGKSILLFHLGSGH